LLDDQEILDIVLVKLEGGNIDALCALGFRGLTICNVDCCFEASEVKFILSNGCRVILLFFVDLKNNRVKEAAAEKASILDKPLLDTFNHFLHISSEHVREAMDCSGTTTRQLNVPAHVKVVLKCTIETSCITMRLLVINIGLLLADHFGDFSFVLSVLPEEGSIDCLELPTEISEKVITSLLVIGWSTSQSGGAVVL